MKKILKRFTQRRNGGFTLVEMTVSVALLGVMMAGMMLFIAPVVRSYNQDKADANAQNVTTCLQEYISRTLRYAYQVTIFENTSYSDIKSNASYTSQIEKMNSFCGAVNGTAVNKTYLLKCLSLKFDSTDNRYYLYEESVNMSANGALDETKSKKVFADCMYSDLYTTFSFSLPKNGDFAADPSKGEFRKDSLQVDFLTYNDKGFSNLVFAGTGISDIRNVKGMLEDGGKDSNYFIKIEPASPLGFADMTDGHRDIYIYYVTRSYGITP